MKKRFLALTLALAMTSALLASACLPTMPPPARSGSTVPPLS